jgi:hypothetical protein
MVENTRERERENSSFLLLLEHRVVSTPRPSFSWQRKLGGCAPWSRRAPWHRGAALARAPSAGSLRAGSRSHPPEKRSFFSCDDVGGGLSRAQSRADPFASPSRFAASRISPAASGESTPTWTRSSGPVRWMRSWHPCNVAFSSSASFLVW